MRNHNQKIKDMARSILPSTRRKGARDDRALIHRRERARLRAALHDARTVLDAEDYHDPRLEHQDKQAIREMVHDRRSCDKIGPLVRWAERTVEKNTRLDADDWDGPVAHFRNMFADDIIGRHALGHIEWAVGIPPGSQFRKIAGRGSGGSVLADPLREAVLAVLESGAHGDLNRRIKQEVATVFVRKIRTASGTVVEKHVRPLRLLGGHHDADAFVAAVRHRDEGVVALTFAPDLEAQS